MLAQLFKQPYSSLQRSLLGTTTFLVQQTAHFFFPPRSPRCKSHYYKLELKAKRRRMRRGKTGGPPKNVDTFRTFIGKTKDVPFLKPKPGFPLDLLTQDDPKTLVKLSSDLNSIVNQKSLLP